MRKVSVLPECRPEEQGIPSEKIRAFIEAVEKNGLELHGFMLLRHGYVVSQGFWNPYRPDYRHSLFSLSKSFTSTAIGFATAEGLISLDDRVISFFPEFLPGKVDKNLSAMKIRHLISMAAGHAEDTTYKMQADIEGNWVRGFLSLPVEYEPGTHFLYNTGATYMLSAIIRKVTGQNLTEYLKPRLFDPLGIETPIWENCPMGTNLGGWGLNIKLDDIAKFGQFYLQKGYWNGKQLLPRKWVDEATSFKISNGNDPKSDWCQGYCYQFWRCRHNAYRGDGAFGQFCVVIPDQDAVFAAVGGLGDLQQLLDLFWVHVLASMSGSALPVNDDGSAALQRKLKSLAYPPLKGKLHSGLESSLSGKRYRLESNDMGYDEVRFKFDKSGGTMFITSSGVESAVGLGMGEWRTVNYLYSLKTEFVLLNFGAKIASSAVWEDDATLRIHMRHIETPFCMSLLFNFADGGLRLQPRLNVSFGPTVFRDITGHVV